jgi:2-dehydro-3-deoxygluconokinase
LSADFNSISQAKFVLNTKRGQISASHNTLSGQCWNGTEMIKTKTIDIPNIIDRIGGGDAFMAGFIYAYITFQDIQKALEYGVAASALKHTVEGDFNLATLQEIEMVVKGDVSGKLKR